MYSNSKILIVDDDLLNVLFIRTALNTQYQLFEAHNGKEAIEKIPEIKPDLLILDWNMPILDGMGVLHFLQNNPEYKETRVIMMTGLMTGLDDLLGAFDNGAIDFIRKPFELSELQARVKSVLKLVYFYKEELQKKNNELVTLAMKLTENIESFKKVFAQLESSSPEKIHDKLQIVKKEFNSLLLENSWKSFEDQFNQVHHDFYTNLAKKHTNLTPSELKLASLLRLNLTTKEIATITFTTPESTKVARSRLRKKLQIELDSNLIAYLMQF